MSVRVPAPHYFSEFTSIPLYILSHDRLGNWDVNVSGCSNIHIRRCRTSDDSYITYLLFLFRSLKTSVVKE